MNIDKAEALRRLGSSKNLANSLPSRVEHRTKEKPHRGPSVPEFVRDTIGTLATTGAASHQDLADAFGIAKRTVSSYNTSHIGGRPPNEDRRRKHEERTAQIKDTALLKLMQSLNLIDEGKLSDLDAKGLSQVACNMGKVVNSLSEQESSKSPVNIVIYSPETKPESRYRVVDV